MAVESHHVKRTYHGFELFLSEESSGSIDADLETNKGNLLLSVYLSNLVFRHILLLT